MDMLGEGRADDSSGSLLWGELALALALLCRLVRWVAVVAVLVEVVEGGVAGVVEVVVVVVEIVAGGLFLLARHLPYLNQMGLRLLAFGGAVEVACDSLMGGGLSHTSVDGCWGEDCL